MASYYEHMLTIIKPDLSYTIFTDLLLFTFLYINLKVLHKYKAFFRQFWYYENDSLLTIKHRNKIGIENFAFLCV